VGLAQLIRFLVVELTHSGLNHRFDMCVVFTANYSFSGRQRPHRQWGAVSDQLRKSQDQVDSVFQICAHRFDMCVVFTTNYFFSGRRRPHRQWCAVSDRLRESQDQVDSVFQICAHKGKMCVHVFIGMSVHTYMSICICTVFLKKWCYNNYGVMVNILLTNVGLSTEKWINGRLSWEDASVPPSIFMYARSSIFMIYNLI
jgi:hypothetical protein